MSLRMKGIVYKACVKSAMCYGAEGWAMRSKDENRIETTEMRMLRMMCGKTLKDKVRNENIRNIVQVENIREYLRSQWLRWYNHVKRMSQDKPPAMTRVYRVQGRKIGRPKKRWQEVINVDLEKRKVKMIDPKNREEWRKGCKYRWTPARGTNT